ncbi:hypothetical protein [Arthrobacter sp. MAHUQ-56]
MIIQAGFDLQILIRPLVVQEGRVLPKLVAVALDADMQLDGIKIVSDEFAGSLTPHLEAILDWMDLDWSRYFAIGHAGIWPENDYYSESPVLQEAKTLEAAAAQRGLRMIGHFGIDETGYMSDGPHSYFDQYGLIEGLPPTMSHWVHSKHGKCG